MRIGIDWVGPLPESEMGNRFILVVIDFFTRWVEAFATKNQEARTTAELLVTEVFSRFSVPYIIHTDQGVQFESALFKEICDLFDVTRTRNSPYHPQCNGMTERVNQTIIQMLATSVDGSVKDWDRRLNFQLLAYRTTVHKSTGFSPFEMIFGYQPRIPLDCVVPTPDEAEVLTSNDLTAAQHYHLELARAYEIARENMGQAQRRAESVYDRKTFGKRFEVGQSVWLHLPVKPKGVASKFWRPWAPAKIIAKISDVDWKIKLDKNKTVKIVHFDRLRRRYTEEDIPAVDGTSSSESETELEYTAEPDTNDGPRCRHSGSTADSSAGSGYTAARCRSQRASRSRRRCVRNAADVSSPQPGTTVCAASTVAHSEAACVYEGEGNSCREGHRSRTGKRSA